MARAQRAPVPGDARWNASSCRRQLGRTGTVGEGFADEDLTRLGAHRPGADLSVSFEDEDDDDAMDVSRDGEHRTVTLPITPACEAAAPSGDVTNSAFRAERDVRRERQLQAGPSFGENVGGAFGRTARDASASAQATPLASPVAAHPPRG